ncbi:MAG TPA: hypothetical protein VFD32_00940 [Dehalococcoidia bacterium]|nr:hypothetical protein [Dehalococcoidia bacterium]
MDLFIALVALALFATMFLPLPAPAALAVVLWALGTGVPLPVVLALYLAQDVLSYLAIQRLLPKLARAADGGTNSRRLPGWLSGYAPRLPGAATSGVGLFSAALLSFYAGAALAAARNGATLRSAALVIGADVLKWTNGLALTLGLAHAVPASPWAPIAASLGVLALIPLLRFAQRMRRPAAAPALVRAH